MVRGSSLFKEKFDFELFFARSLFLPIFLSFVGFATSPSSR
jgi:hypothetical protein